MTEDYSIIAIHDAGHELIELGYHLVPCGIGTKRPLIPWKDSESSHKLLDAWFDRFRLMINIAIHVGKSGVVVLDGDTPEACAWIAANCPTPMTVETPRGGVHVFFRADGDVKAARDLHGIPGLEVQRHLILASPSWSEEHGRCWRWTGEVLPPSELPTIDPALIAKEPTEKPNTADPGRPVRRSSGAIRDVTRWIMAVPSRQGHRGSDACFKVCCKLADAGFSREEAMHWLRIWNGRMAEPPWSENELLHKLDDAFNR